MCCTDCIDKKKQQPISLSLGLNVCKLTSFSWNYHCTLNFDNSVNETDLHSESQGHEKVKASTSVGF